MGLRPTSSKSKPGAQSEQAAMAREIGVHPKSGKPVTVRMGRYGPFVQIGTKDDEEKPKFAGLRPGQKMDDITLEIALELEKIALNDEYFVKRKLYPNVDFYSGLIYQSMGFPVEMFPVLFAIPRAAGWLAQWSEMLADNAQKIARPRQIYTGAGERDYVPLDKR